MSARLSFFFFFSFFPMDMISGQIKGKLMSVCWLP